MTSVSVIIPAYNAEKFLAAALDSVLTQCLRPCEVIVVDDGSTDDTYGVALQFGGVVQCIRQDNAGTGAARNAALAVTRSEYVAFLDADDLMLPERLKLQFEVLQTKDAPDLVFGQQLLFRHGESVPTATPDRIRSGVAAGTLFTRRDAFEKFGYFPVELRIGEFVTWMQNAKNLGATFVSLEQSLICRRLHATSTSQTSRPDYAQLIRTLRNGRMASRRIA